VHRAQPAIVQLCRDAPDFNYEGRPINKLQNGAIPSVLNIGKIRNIRFVGNLILSKSCEFYYDDVTVTSFVNDKYGDATAESIP